ncbi:hypothetical protein [Flavobacterium sp. UMI-01]|uniref:hypothetical protein n=1 Tax=Flavobacterium sp. UMI-01 TaxID=1441053 RepID=UPI001C7D910C|nr:hypothetical protein [Flavobacterium sp. UMI-01]GIZ10079.1 hypothetical protein FUMI01_28050 [Flavobacterium sp. UMI-01]
MTKLISTSLLLFSVIVGFSQNAINYLETKNTLTFDNQDYNLVWSTHPNATYYKQEYLPKEEKLDRFKKMVTIDFLQGDFKVKDFVNQKIQELENAKKLNPVINYNVVEKGEETILDFLMSVNSKDGKTILVVERNVYRYKKYQNADSKGLLLYAVSERAYDNEIADFFKKLKTDKNNLMTKVSAVEIPAINLKK